MRPCDLIFEFSGGTVIIAGTPAQALRDTYGPSLAAAMPRRRTRADFRDHAQQPMCYTNCRAISFNSLGRHQHLKREERRS